MPDPATFQAQIRGARVVNLARRGKFLLFQLSDDRHLLVHLRMTGQLHVLPANATLHPHTRAVFYLDNGTTLHFRDQRKFGRFYLVREPELVVGKLGPEPLDPKWTPEDLHRRLQQRRAAIKSVLLDQKVIAGLGNIYADEALFVAGIHPLRTAASLSEKEVQRLFESIRQVLREAIDRGGTTIQTFVRPAGSAGTYQHRRRVYRRAGQPCVRCGTPILRQRIGGRSTYFCPRCQPADNSSGETPVRR